MKLELRNISYNARLSEETNAYAAKLYADGIWIADVSNHGTGGCDEVRARPGMKANLENAEAWCKAQPPLPSTMEGCGDLPFDLELFCGQEVDKHIVASDYRRAIKRKVLMLCDDGKVRESSWRGLKAIEPKHIAIVAAKYPTAKILNTMPEAEALAIYAKAA